MTNHTSDPTSGPTGDPGEVSSWAERAKARAAAKQHAPQTPVPAATEAAAKDAVIDAAADGAPELRRRLGRNRAPGQTPTASALNPFLPDSDKEISSASARAGQVDSNDEDGAEEERAGLAATGFGHTTGPSNPPVAPAPLNPALPVPTSWPTEPLEQRAELVQLVGLHGGAGTSTLAAEFGHQAVDCGVGLRGLRSIEVPVLFVARTHARGLDLALRMAQQHASRSLGPVMVLGIVVVPDAPGGLSKQLARTLRSVQKAYPNCWTIPWSEDLRHDVALPEPATRGPRGRNARRVLRKATVMAKTRTPPHQQATAQGSR